MQYVIFEVFERTTLTLSLVINLFAGARAYCSCKLYGISDTTAVDGCN